MADVIVETKKLSGHLVAEKVGHPAWPEASYFWQLTSLNREPGGRDMVWASADTLEEIEGIYERRYKPTEPNPGVCWICNQERDRRGPDGRCGDCIRQNRVRLAELAGSYQYDYGEEF